jgi:hypothetical protein
MEYVNRFTLLPEETLFLYYIGSLPDSTAYQSSKADRT